MGMDLIRIVISVRILIDNNNDNLILH